MKAEKSIYLCDECGEGSVQWLGRCPACATFGSMREERKEPARGRSSSSKAQPIQMKHVGEEPLRIKVRNIAGDEVVA